MHGSHALKRGAGEGNPEVGGEGGPGGVNGKAGYVSSKK